MLKQEANTKILLWLDDYRNPFENDYEWLKYYSPWDITQVPTSIVWCKDYDEFEKAINSFGFPDGICFDHDLGDGKSGYDCAKLMVEKCLDNNVPFPPYNIQSANPVGRLNIQSLIENYNSHFDSVNF